MFNYSKKISKTDCVVDLNLQNEESIQFLQLELATLDHLMIQNYTSLVDKHSYYCCCYFCFCKDPSLLLYLVYLFEGPCTVSQSINHNLRTIAILIFFYRSVTVYKATEVRRLFELNQTLEK